MTFPLFVLVGDPFLCEEKRKELLTSLQKEFGSNLSVSLRRAGDFSVKDLLSEARTLPFLSPAQVFCARDAHEFTKDEILLWGEYFKSPNPQSFIFFESDALEKTHPFIQWANQAKQVYFLQAESPRVASRFIQEKLKRAGKKITSDAQRLLEEQVGDSYLFLDSVLERLVALAGEKIEIDRSLVSAVQEKLEQFQTADLLNAISERNSAKALAVLNDLLDENFRDFPAVLGLLHWQLRRLWEVKGPSSRFTKRELEKILEGLFGLDWQLKTGRAEGRYEIESWLVRTLG